MGNHMNHSLINPNQLRYYGIKVQDNPLLETAISIITEDNEFCMEIAMAGTVVYAKKLLHMSKNYTSVHTSHYHRLTHRTQITWYSIDHKEP